MKTTLRTLFVGILLATTSIASAQQVNTLYFLENAPMRHTINPAFQPASIFYLEFPVIGYTSLWAGTNSWTISDFLFKGPQGNTITPLHPDAKNWLDSKPNSFVLDADIYTNLLGFGFRIKEKGYFHFNISERLITDISVSNSIFQLNKINTVESISLKLGLQAMAYTDISLGYSHQINEKWTVGGKLKILLGQANIKASINNLTIGSSIDSLYVHGAGEIHAAAPLQWKKLPTSIEDFNNFDYNKLLFADNASTQQMILDFLKPAGMGFALDLGMSYKPIKNLQISASITDLGFMRWHRHARASMEIDTTFYGIDLEHEDFMVDGAFSTDSLQVGLNNTLGGYVDALHISKIDNAPRLPDMNMLNANLNIGIDANFWDNRVGVGIYSRTRFHNSRVTEELTLGAAFRPFNWINIAASYSFINGHWSNLGAALSIAPYDGIMLTLATDYIPLTYAKASTDLGNLSLPYKTPGMNVSFGIAIVAGTNPKAKDRDKDGVLDNLDICPHTPLNVNVDEMGCPLDTDGDGVADYLDECPHTPSAAYGMIDSVGCPIDSDGDGVHDYRDLCPDTPIEAIAFVDENGCLLDSDGDGIDDYIDLCPNTPAAAYGMIDSVGCPLDSDDDGVYDYIDLCPNTPKEAKDLVDHLGCPIDTDKDGVYDYCDSCPNTIAAARNHVDSVGCALDTDGDGVYDYEDLCPTIAGVKENKGCPEIKREVRNLLTKAMSGIQFENGKATIRENSYKILDDIATLFIDNPTYKVEIQGHTDNVGKYSYNVDLSDRRAHAVRAYMINKGVPAARLTARGFGPDMPIADNKTKEGRAKNRRVEFNITFEEVTYETVYDRVQN